MSQQEMDRNAAEIVELLKFLDTDEVKQETIKAMKNKTMKYEFLTENLMLVKINNEWKVKGQKIRERRKYIVIYLYDIF